MWTMRRWRFSLQLLELGSLPLRIRSLISVPSAMSFSRAFSSGKGRLRPLSIYGVAWRDHWLSGASPIIRHSHLFLRTGRAWQPLRSISSSGGLYSGLFVTDHPWLTALSLLSLMPWTSVTRKHPRPCQNFSGTVFLSSLAASNSLSPCGPLGRSTTTSLVPLLFTV